MAFPSRTSGPAVFVTLALMGLSGMAAPADHGGPLKLRDVLWQWLPGEVQSVSVGPDDRTWLVGEVPEKPHDIDSAKAAIAREFEQPTPRLAGIRPVLFEPGKRVWFRVDPGQMLLAFDGTAWIEKTLPLGRRFTGDCLGQGSTAGGGPNLLVGGHRFFTESRGVHVFDGTTWTLREVTDESEHPRLPWTLKQSLEGDDVIAVTTEPRMIVWRWHDGAWSDVPCDIPHAITACPGPDRSIWFFQADDSVVPRTADSARNVADRTVACIKTLEAATTDEERQAAITALQECGPEGIPLVEKALEATFDPEILGALVAAGKGMKQRGATRVGDLVFQRAHSAIYDPIRRRLVFFASDVRLKGKPVADGPVIISADGATTTGPFPPLLWNRLATRSRNPVFSTGGTSVWFDGSSGNFPARQIDLDSMAIRIRAPDPQFTCVQAVRSDGTVFLSSGDGGAGLAAFRPGLPDDRRLLDVEVLFDSGSPDLLGCDAAGGVWVYLADRGLVRLKDDRHQTIEDPTANQYQRFGSLLAGSRGDVLLFGDQRFGYWRDGALSVSSDLQKLIAAHREAIADSFNAGQLPPVGHVSCGIVVDEQRNIWLRSPDRGLPFVLVGTTWLAAGNALKEAGARAPYVRHLAAAGGDSVYVSDLSLIHDGGRSFFARFLDGQPTFREAPHSVEGTRLIGQVRDRDGGLWIPANVLASSGSFDRVGDQLAHRILDGKVESTLTNAGWPAICDPAGVVWLDKVAGRPRGTVNFWWNGTVAGSVRIPGLLYLGASRSMPALYSCRPGSGWAWTNRGLVHLVAAPATPAAFSLAETYSIGGNTGTFEPMMCTKDGLLIGSLFDDLRGHALGSVRLPQPSPAAAPDRN
jgi:hypothetical protein